MSKKKTPEVLPAVTVQAEVSNNINLNLNQNDLIDLAIQEHLEKLEIKIQDLKTQQKNIQKEMRIVEREQAEKLAKEILKDDSTYNKFLKALKMLDLKITYPTNEDGDKYYHRYDPYRLQYNQIQEKLLGTVTYYDDNAHYTNLSHVSRSVRPHNHYLNNYFKLIIDISEGTKNEGVVMQFHSSIDLDAASIKQLESKIHPLQTKEYEISKELSSAQREFYEYTFGEKKVKAKIVKASLQRSAEGQAILNMLQGATGVKLIG